MPPVADAPTVAVGRRHLLWGLGVFAALWAVAVVATPLGFAWSVEVAQGRVAFPIPLAWWFGAFLFSAAASSLTGQPWRRLVAQSALLGIVLHLALSAAVLGVEVWMGRRSVSTTAYRFYVVVASGVWLASIGCWWLRPALQRASAWLTEPRRWTCVVFTAALLIRLAYLSRQLSDPDYLQAGADGPLYDGIARDWALGHFGVHPWVGSPGYLHWLSLWYRWLGYTHLPVFIAQVILGGVICVVIYRIALRLTDQTTAALTGGFAAINFPLTFSSVVIGHQVLDTTLSMIGLYCLLRYRAAQRRGRWLWLSAAAIAFGYGAATREPSVLVIGFVCVWLLITGRRQWLQQAGETLWFGAIAFGICALILIPVLETGTHLYTNRALQAMYFTRGIARLESFGWNPFADPAQAWHLFLTQPLTVLTVVGLSMWDRLTMLLCGQSYGHMDLFFLVRESAYYFAAWWYVYMALVVGLFTWRRWIASHAGGVLLLGFLACRLAPHLLFESAYRYRPPMEPILILFAVGGAGWSYRTLRRMASVSPCEAA